MILCCTCWIDADFTSVDSIHGRVEKLWYSIDTKRAKESCNSSQGPIVVVNDRTVDMVVFSLDGIVISWHSETIQKAAVPRFPLEMEQTMEG